MSHQELDSGMISFNLFLKIMGSNLEGGGVGGTGEMNGNGTEDI